MGESRQAGRQAGEGRPCKSATGDSEDELAGARGGDGRMDGLDDGRDGRGAGGRGSGGERNRVCAARERRRGGIMK